MCFVALPSGEERRGPTYQWGKSLSQEVQKWLLYLRGSENLSCNKARLRFSGKSVFTKQRFPPFVLLLGRYLLFWMCFVKAEGRVMLKFKCFVFRDNFLNSLYSTWFLHYLDMGNNLGVEGGGKGGSSSFFYGFCCCHSGPHKQATCLSPLKVFTELLPFAVFV